MKKIITGFLVCMVALVASGDECRIFTDSQGRAIEAKIVSFDSVKGTVQMEREDGRRVWVSPKLFSADDQYYIQQWIAANQVLSDRSLRVSFKKKTLDSFNNKKTKGKAGSFSKGDIICYEVTLTNRSKQPIVGLRIESQYFVRVDNRINDTETIRQVGPNTHSVNMIGPGESVTIKTAKLTLEEKIKRTKVTSPGQSGVILGYDEKKVSEEDLLGIWLKIYGPKVGDEPSLREVCDPPDLSKKASWEE